MEKKWHSSVIGFSSLLAAFALPLAFPSLDTRIAMALVAIAVILFFAVGIRQFRKEKGVSAHVNYRKWREMDDFRLWQVAYLWHDLEPPPKFTDMPLIVKNRLDHLKTCYNNFHLNSTSVDAPSRYTATIPKCHNNATYDLPVTRSDLLDLTKDYELRPRFLRQE